MSLWLICSLSYNWASDGYYTGILYAFYLLILTANLVSLRFNKDYLTINIGNVLLSLLIILVFQINFTQYPPFGSNEASSGGELFIIVCFYLSFLASACSVIWIAIKTLSKKRASIV
jgi:hypothetical protein